MLSYNLPKSAGGKHFVLVELSSNHDQTSLFIDGLDRAYFVTLFQRYFSTNRTKFAEYSRFRNYSYDLELLAFSLTDHKISLLFNQLRVSGVEQLLRSLLSGYNRYFNARHKHNGELFRNNRNLTYMTIDDAVKVSRTIHRQASDWRTTRYSSLGFYIDERRGDWVRPLKITQAFNNSPQQYLAFVQD